MGSRRVKFDSPLLDNRFESLTALDRQAILSTLKDFSDGTEDGSAVPEHPGEIALASKERNWAINLIERDGIFFVIEIDNTP